MKTLPEHPENERGSLNDRERDFLETGRFRPGHQIRSPRKNRYTPTEKEVFLHMKKLATGTAEKLQGLLESPETPPMTKVKICSLILDYTYGKPEESLQIVTNYEPVSHRRDAVFALIHRMMNQKED